MNKISSLVSNQIPSFAHEEYPVFVSFMESYYQWLEEEGNTLNFIEGYKQNLDVDFANEEFIAEYLEEFVEYLPKDKKIDDSTLIKLIKEFYLSKGSEQSFKFLFTILFNEHVDIIYPREDMFKASDGTWSGDIFLKVTNNNYDKLDLSNPDVNIKVVGRRSGAVAIVDTISEVLGDFSYTELELSSFSKDFIVGERVNLHVDDAIVIETTIGGVVDTKILDGGSGNSVNDIISITSDGSGQDFKALVTSVSVGELNRYTVLNAGQGYAVGEFVYAQSDASGEGFGYIGTISQVDVSGEIVFIDIVSAGSSYNHEVYVKIDSVAGEDAVVILQGDNVGKVTNLEITDSGLNYDPSDTYTTIINDIDVNITPIVGCIFTDVQSYTDIKGFPSYNSIIQDSYYYQIFSYALKSKVRPELWRGLVKRIAHPTGTELFAIWDNEASVYMGDNSVESAFSYLFTIISELAMADVIEFSNSPVTKNINSSNTCSTFHSLNDLDEIKFSPNFKWNVEEFKDLSLEDLSTQCFAELYLTNDSEITIT